MKNIIKKLLPDNLVLKDDFYEKTGELYDKMFASVKEDDFNFYLNFTPKIRNNILDLAAGTGRLSFFFAKHGFDVTALEISPKMTEIFNNKLKSDDYLTLGKIFLIRADMSNFYLKKKYCYVVMGYNSFNHLLQRKEQIDCLKCINRCMKIGGTLAMEILPVIRSIPGSKKLRYEKEFKKTGEKIFVYSKIKQDTPEYHKIWWYFVVIDKHGNKHKKTSSFIRAEIEINNMIDMLKETGFELISLYYDYEMSSKIGDKRLIVAEKIYDVFK